MIYTLFNLRDRKILQGEVDGEHYDSKVMARRGQDWQQGIVTGKPLALA